MTGSWSPKRRIPPWSSAFSTLQNALSHVKLADIGIPVAIAPHGSQSGDDRSRGYHRQASADGVSCCAPEEGGSAGRNVAELIVVFLSLFLSFSFLTGTDPQYQDQDQSGFTRKSPRLRLRLRLRSGPGKINDSGTR
ncbi:hypothetical protein FCULG_00010507 [Fusarium culmorum]|uniref:Uncharacterized protein n=1 Tax=Fusarium culmorum TaxID=5516 RepID=A0A2T4GEA5_FUSCU|nr:hypothetical protein FCULG_00010507 [Fusarium culmorum]